MRVDGVRLGVKVLGVTPRTRTVIEASHARTGKIKGFAVAYLVTSATRGLTDISVAAVKSVKCRHVF